jgi:hypothetical protein
MVLNWHPTFGKDKGVIGWDDDSTKKRQMRRKEKKVTLSMPMRRGGRKLGGRWPAVYLR